MTDYILALGKRQDMVGNDYDIEKCELFYIPKGTVKSRLYAARTTIKEHIEAMEKSGTKLYGAGVGISILTALNTFSQNIEPSNMIIQNMCIL